MRARQARRGHLLCCDRPGRNTSSLQAQTPLLPYSSRTQHSTVSAAVFPVALSTFLVMLSVGGWSLTERRAPTYTHSMAVATILTLGGTCMASGRRATRARAAWAQAAGRAAQEAAMAGYTRGGGRGARGSCARRVAHDGGRGQERGRAGGGGGCGGEGAAAGRGRAPGRGKGGRPGGGGGALSGLRSAPLPGRGGETLPLPGPRALHPCH